MTMPDSKAHKLSIGLYEQVVNHSIASQVSEAKKEKLDVDICDLDAGDSHIYLAHYLASHVRKAFSSFSESERLNRQVELVNQILVLLAESAPETFDASEAGLLRAELLLGVLNRPIERPDTPLAISCLMTGTRQDPSLLSQLRKEFQSADKVDILCSFIKWGGVRILEDPLREHSEAGRSTRIITTSYMGATDFKAVEFLRELPGTELRVSYDTRRTRLHAKAYIFQRQTGFGTAYIGSSNLSQSALTDGLEWNVKISQHESPHLWVKLCATFDTYWNDPEFVPYSLDSRERLRQALKDERGDTRQIYPIFDVRPYPFQQEILDKLAAERLVHGRFRNLIVAATGTGKTIVSAFDYDRYNRQLKSLKRSRLLFIAHREEILTQSISSFRGVLRDHNFGDLLVGDSQPQSLDHLFVSIQSFNSRELWDQIPPDFYDFVVVDEFHHAAAPSYQKLLKYIEPKVLLGLTATPERTDALDILRYFGGHIAAEIRLPDAINRKLLCPFQYFGITDAENVDYRGLRWQRGGYVIEDLDQLLTGNDIRSDLIITKIQEILLDVHSARGLGFCVSVRHADYMAAVFNRAGIPAIALSANSPRDLRHNARCKLVNREINFIFVVDLYNEGVDIPEVDTILLLRPTESLTVFLQQLGRGLRLHSDKDCLTILDFIGQTHENFNFEARFRALIGPTSRRIDEEIEHRLPHLPAGCAINLERIAQERILENISQASTHNLARLVHRIRTYHLETDKPLALHDFMEYHRLDFDDIYQRGTWSRLLVKADIGLDFTEPDEERLTKGFRRLAHINAANQIKSLLEILTASSNSRFEIPHDQMKQRFLLMLHFTLWTREWLPEDLSESVRRLQLNPTLYQEFMELLKCKFQRIDEVPIELELPFLCPLQLHADYTRDEILAALGFWTLKKQRDVREGVLYISELPADLLFVTLNKTETDYSPSTMYEDYAISDQLFHWQSQSTTSENSRTGQRYIHQSSNKYTVFLFVREDKRRNGLSMPYTFLGPVDYVQHEGSRPMNIIWRLRYSIPSKLLRNTRRLANE